MMKILLGIILIFFYRISDLSSYYNVNLLYSSPGSANSLAKSMNGSIKSDTLSAGSGGTTGEDGLGMDGDNINVVIRVRPLNQKELKSGDESILTFPGDGGIWVRKMNILNFKEFICTSIYIYFLKRIFANYII